MTQPFTIVVDARQADAWFGGLIRRGSDLSGLMADIGEELTESTQARFNTGIGPDGVAWQPLANGSGRTPLGDTYRMRDGIHPMAGVDWVEIRSDAKQARWHQQGTQPYVIKPRNGKALAFGPPASRLTGANAGTVGPAYVVGQVNHPGLPARPFIGLSEDDAAALGRLSIAWLELDDPVG